MASKRPVVVAKVSDVHCGSTLAPCPPEGVRLDDEGTYKPSKAQLWLWECWNETWAFVAALRAKHKAKLVCVYNGDSFEGDHHKTSQIISRNPEPAAYVSDRVFGVPRSLQPDQQFIVRGTEAHVGPSGATEEGFARSMKAERNPETRTWSWWHLRLNVHGVRFDFQHHPGTHGKLPWTAPQGAVRLAFLVWSEHKLREKPHPHLAIRSHVHVHRDSFDAYPTRAIITPAFQLKTGHAHKVASESIADVGGIATVVYPDGQYEVHKKLFEPEMPPVMEVA